MSSPADISSDADRSDATAVARDHWDAVYRASATDRLSWTRAHLDTSLDLLQRAGLAPGARLIDVGGGASTLVDDLLARGLDAITVVDLSEAALAQARYRVGAAAPVRWLAGDITRIELPPAAFDLWHDRAVLHFLLDDATVAAYARQAARAVRPGGCAVIGGFGPEGPERCSGLPVARRSPAAIAAALGAAFALEHASTEIHHTPAGRPQAFAWALLRRLD
jgi:SAM-dependent methyltransferase